MNNATPERACRSVGIDLGTTYSALAYIDSQQTPRVVCNSSGQSIMPSIVCFDNDDVIVGDMALAQATANPEQIAQFIKVHMGEPWRAEFNGREHTPESISALILSQLVRDAEPQIGPIDSAVITVPAYFNERRRRATQQAGEIAGLEVAGVLNEPMAAALAYGLHHGAKEQLALIYDLGGGTFDVTVVRIAPNELEELATNGNRQMGGRDWDQALIDLVCDEFRTRHDRDVREDLSAMQALRIECESAKRRLGRINNTSIRVQSDGLEHICEITRERFESLTAPLVQATKLTAEMALEDASLSWSTIDRVVLVGGSTNMPAVRRMLEQASGRSPDTGVNPIAAVALGAAIYAHILETDGQLRAIASPSIDDTLPSIESAPDTSSEEADAASPEEAIDDFAEDDLATDDVEEPFLLTPAPQDDSHPGSSNDSITLHGAATQTGRPAEVEKEASQADIAESGSDDDLSIEIETEPLSSEDLGPREPQSHQQSHAASGDESEWPSSHDVPVVRFVTAHGVGVLVRSSNAQKNVVMIPRNARVPAAATRRFNTAGKAEGGRSVAIRITQGDAPQAELVDVLGDGRIDLPQTERPGAPVDVTMSFDEQGRLHARAVYVLTGQDMRMTLQVRGGLREEELQAYQEFVEKTDFQSNFDAAEAISRLEEADDQEDELADDLADSFDGDTIEGDDSPTDRWR